MTISQAFQIAVQRHQAGRLAEAEALYRQILAAQPNHAEALHLLGVIAHQNGRHDLAVEWIRKAIVVNPNNPAAYSNLGEACRMLGRFDEAIAACRCALQLKPDYPEARNHLGNALRDRGQLDEAILSYRHAIELKPDCPEAHANLGNALKDHGQLDEAVAAFRRALEIRADYPDAHNSLGIALAARGELDEAIASYRCALRFKADFPDASYNLGYTLREQGRLDEGVAWYRRALQLKPNFPEAHYNLGIALWEQGHLDEAIASYRRALEIKPDHPQAFNNLGNALKDQGDLEGAIASYRRTLELKPDDAKAHSNLLYAICCSPGYDERTISEEHQRWSVRFGDPLKQFVQPHANDRGAERRLRIGYLSPDFRDHPVGRYLLPLFECHDREWFEVFCYSGVARPDFITERLRARAARWRNTLGIADAGLAEMIREDGVDILVDLALHTAGNRLPVFARQPAPVQIAWLGYPGSTGLRSIGYRLTDARMDPLGSRSRGTAWSAEEAVRLPDCWCCYHPVDESPEVNALPALSGKGVVFGSLNNFHKVHEGVLALWARVMDALKGSRLVMFCPEGMARERVRTFFGARGIVPERVELVGFQPRWGYLRTYQRIDIGLDPFPCNGMTTTCDALWMGVPLLTLPGQMPASRAGLSLLSSIGLGELAASSEDDYLRIAVELAGNLPRLADMRATLRARMQSSPLMDAPRFARNVEAAYRKMWHAWCVGKSPIREDL